MWLLEPCEWLLVLTASPILAHAVFAPSSFLYLTCIWSSPSEYRIFFFFASLLHAPAYNLEGSDLVGLLPLHPANMPLIVVKSPSSQQSTYSESEPSKSPTLYWAHILYDLSHICALQHPCGSASFLNCASLCSLKLLRTAHHLCGWLITKFVTPVDGWRSQKEKARPNHSPAQKAARAATWCSCTLLADCEAAKHQGQLCCLQLCMLQQFGQVWGHRCCAVLKFMIAGQ